MPLLAEINDSVLHCDELLERCLGKRELALRVLDRFKTQLAQDLDLLQVALQDRDLYRMARVAHRIKGAAANVSAHALHQHAAALEEAADEKVWPVIRPLMQQLLASSQEFETMYQAFRDSSSHDVSG